MWNPFKKSVGDDKQKMGMLSALAMKKMEKMSPQEREKMAQEVLKPENRDKLLSAMEQLEKTGMINEEQVKLAKEKLGF
jgi:transcriptional regulator of NAD metabolism